MTNQATREGAGAAIVTRQIDFCADHDGIVKIKESSTNRRLVWILKEDRVPCLFDFAHRSNFYRTAVTKNHFGTAMAKTSAYLGLYKWVPSGRLGGLGPFGPGFKSGPACEDCPRG
jgi:hypothetical protein